MRAMAQAPGPEAHGTLLLLLAMPCLLPVPGVGTVLGLGMAALAAAIWRGLALFVTAGLMLRAWVWGSERLAIGGLRAS